MNKLIAALLLPVIALGSGCVGEPLDQDTEDGERIGAAEQAFTATFFVETTADRPDKNPGDGQCAAKGFIGSKCSLRAAIQEANAAPGSYAIVLEDGQTYVLDELGTAENAGITGDLDIQNDVLVKTFTGRAVVRGKSGWNDRIFHVHPDARLSLLRIDVQNGDTQTGNAAGGGIRVEPQGEADLTLSTVSGCKATSGGGIFVFANATLALDDSEIRGNDASNRGGGIFNAGTLTAFESEVLSNVADVAGGGITNTGAATLDMHIGTISVALNTAPRGGGVENSGSMLITRVRVEDNTANIGGGIDNSGTIEVSGRVTGNVAQLRAGGINNTGTATLRSVITLNEAQDAAGIDNAGTAILLSASVTDNFATGAAGGVRSSNSLQADDCNFENNQAASAGGLLNSGTLTLTNSMVQLNSAQSDAGAIENSGTASLNNVTLVGNSADNGGGIVNNAGAKLNLKNSIIANNTASLAPDCLSVGAPLGSGGFNLIENRTGCDVGGAGAPDDLPPQDPELQSNGSALPGSPVIDAGSPAAPGSGGSACELNSFGNRLRPRDGDGDGVVRCDIGAFER